MVDEKSVRKNRSRMPNAGEHVFCWREIHGTSWKILNLQASLRFARFFSCNALSTRWQQCFVRCISRCWMTPVIYSYILLSMPVQHWRVSETRYKLFGDESYYHYLPAQWWYKLGMVYSENLPHIYPHFPINRKNYPPVIHRGWRKTEGFVQSRKMVNVANKPWLVGGDWGSHDFGIFPWKYWE